MNKKDEIISLEIKCREALGYYLGVVDALLIFHSCDVPLEPRLFKDIRDKRDAYLAASREVLDARLG